MSIAGLLSRLMVIHKNNPCDASMNARKPTLLRSLFTVGLLCKHFDFDSNEMGETKVRNYQFYVILIKYENFKSKDFSNCWITISLEMHCFLCHRKVRDLLGICFWTMTSTDVLILWWWLSFSTTIFPRFTIFSDYLCFSVYISCHINVTHIKF